MELDNIIKKVAGTYLASAIIAVIVLIVTLGQPFVVFLGIGAMGLVSVLALGSGTVANLVLTKIL